ncbi:hypothetical protein [Listeria costaricensis]|uniref:hypothetical protein n=1 Tax=Listeria costaricensis TaxID=2026604 RepID=UPI000C078A4F|nr:hypothetical protein [Listeria costaricensis]
MRKNIPYMLIFIYAMTLSFLMGGSSLQKNALKEYMYVLIPSVIVFLFLCPFFKGILEKRAQKNEEDERYKAKRDRFSFYFLMALFIFVPIAIFISNLSGISLIESTALVKMLAFIIVIYMSGMYVYQKN